MRTIAKEMRAAQWATLAIGGAAVAAAMAGGAVRLAMDLAFSAIFMAMLLHDPQETTDATELEEEPCRS